LLCLILLSCPNNLLEHAVAHLVEDEAPEGHEFVS
jgi:hypothetical protein